MQDTIDPEYALAPPFEHEEWYTALFDECQAILTEYSFMSRWARVEGYWTVGKRILETFNNMKRKDVYGRQVLRKLSEQLGTSERTLHYATQFARKYEDLSTLPYGKAATWTRVCSELLPETTQDHSDQKKRMMECPHCHMQIEIQRSH